MATLAVGPLAGESTSKIAWAQHAERPTAAALPTEAPAVAVPAATKRLGVGYKAGNGLGYLGADLNVTALSHVDVDLQVGWFNEKYGASGFGMAPTIRLTWNGAGRSTPFLALGVTYFRLTFDGGARGSGDGGLANLGYEWKWPSGLGIVLGGGILYLRDVRASDRRTMILGAEGLHANLEFGVRYRFL